MGLSSDTTAIRLASEAMLAYETYCASSSRPYEDALTGEAILDLHIANTGLVGRAALSEWMRLAALTIEEAERLRGGPANQNQRGVIGTRKNRPHLTAAERERIVTAIEGGVSISELCAELDVTRQTVHRVSWECRKQRQRSAA